MYRKNLLYILKHKWYYFLEAIKLQMFIHAFTHDLSKFTWVEFEGYALKFHSENTKDRVKKLWKWNKAYHHHIEHNKHHWNHWIDKKTNQPKCIPNKYIKQMICDWQAMGRQFGSDAINYYKKNKRNMLLSPYTILGIECNLAFYYNNGEMI